MFWEFIKVWGEDHKKKETIDLTKESGEFVECFKYMQTYKGTKEALKIKKNINGMTPFEVRMLAKFLIEKCV